MKVQRKILTPFKSTEARVVGGRKVVERRGLSIKIEIMIKEIVLSSSFKLQTLAPLHTTHAKNLLWSFQWHPAQKTHFYRTIPVWEKLQNCSSISFFGARFAMSLWSCSSIPFWSAFTWFPVQEGSWGGQAHGTPPCSSPPSPAPTSAPCPPPPAAAPGILSS